jgi:guanylate kinase
MSRGELFIVSAPSGAGKTTLIRNLLERGLSGAENLAFSVSHTTRRPRDGEVEGRDYHFVTPSEFQRMADTGAFLEWAQVHNHLYGTAREEVFPRLEQGTDVVLDIDVQGAEQVLARCPQAHSIFVLPPSYEDLERRLAGRGLDGPDEIRGRLDVSLWEITRYDRYKYVIINEDARRASEALAAIILEKRHRQERMRDRIQQVLASFPRTGLTPT